MRRIIVSRYGEETVHIEVVVSTAPIFAKQDGVLKGMIVKESGGWILRIGGSGGATGWHTTREECILSCLEYGYEFFTE